MTRRKIDLLNTRYLRIRFTITVELVLFWYPVILSGRKKTNPNILLLSFLGKKIGLPEPTGL